MTKIREHQGTIEDASKGYLDEQLMYLEKFSQIDCPSRDIDGNKEVVEIVKEILGKIDTEVEEVFCEGYGTHIIARIKPKESRGKIIISAHLDTAASVFKKGDVEKNPFRIDGDWAYGVGISDCKGGVMTSIYSIRIMQEQGLLPNKEIVIILNCDEEIGSPSAKSIFERESKSADMAFVFEPTRDENCIITSRTGVAIFQIDIEGRGGHPCIAFEQGRSAAAELAYQTVRLHERTDLKNITYDISDLYSSGSISEKATAKVVATLRSKEGHDLLLKHIKDIEEKPFIDGCKCKVDLQVVHPPMERTEKSLELYKILNEAGAMIGFDYPEKAVNGASDGCLFSGYGVPTVDGIGPYMKEIHTYNERVYIPSITERTTLMALTLGMIK